jgi:hypothetical protein
MATFGESIRIYLSDGTVTGIKFGEIVNKTIQSISCPRLKTSELNNYPESKSLVFIFFLAKMRNWRHKSIYR